MLIRDVRTGLLVQPPRRKLEFLCDIASLFQHDTVRHERGIHVPGHPRSIVRKPHGRATDNEQVSHHAPAHQPVSQCCKGLFQLGPAEEPVAAQAASRSLIDK
jgi:hypothetical protein